MKDAILRKACESAALAVSFCEENADLLERAARALAVRFAENGCLFVVGNGGSACEAQHVAMDFSHPIVEKRRALPAHALSADSALLTLRARPSDAVLGISASGASASVNRALARARQLGLLTLAFTGRDGGAMADLAELCFVVPNWSVHRIQETHTLLLHLLWDHVHVALGEDDVL